MQRRSRLHLLVGTGIVIIGAVVFFLYQSLVPHPEPSVVVPLLPRVPRLLDGVLVESQQARVRSVGIVIDAMVEGRPTIGLARAPLVWEAPVEGGITRFFAVYPIDAIPEKVGPIRSLRPYFLDFAREVSAILLHVGGSPEALRLAKISTIDRLDQFFDYQYFWRSRDRLAPHNVFTSRFLVEKAMADRAFASDVAIPSWRYGARASQGNSDERGVTIAYSTPPYEVVWQWNALAEHYERMMGGAPHRDEDGTLVTAKNVIVQYTDVAILDTVGRRRIRTDGEGRVLVLSGGAMIEATWKHEAGDRTRFFNRATQEEIVFSPGTTWINIVPIETDVTVTSSPPRTPVRGRGCRGRCAATVAGSDSVGVLQGAS